MKYLVSMVCALMVSSAMAEVPYVTGGIGKPERDMIMTQKHKYNFEVKVALKSGHYLGDVAISVTDEAGKEVLNAVTDGPLFFAKLDAGKYEVSATYGDQLLKKSVSIAENTEMREVIFRFDGNEEKVDE